MYLTNVRTAGQNMNQCKHQDIYVLDDRQTFKVSSYSEIKRNLAKVSGEEITQ